jgi:hypothetical protein
MRELKNKFWTSRDEMVTELEEEYFMDVVYVDDEMLEVVTQDEETKVFPLITANNTITIKF